ncbi:MAG TPA: hypothetical protein VKV24_12505 [Casimicrobiaceae bacterium]|nr:hypothetical protein [Casimicrobiaceae bacterium]
MSALVAGEETDFFPPQTPARPVVDVLHGTTLADRYRWLENGKDQEVATWTRAQHAATLRHLDRHAPPVPGMKDELSLFRPRQDRSIARQARPPVLPAHARRAAAAGALHTG